MTAVNTVTGEIVGESSPTPYQLLPRLTDDEYNALKADIAENGIRVPIDVDENGVVIDGHHRSWIAADLGVDCPRRVVTGLTDEQKRAHAIAANVYRRSLTREQRREMVRKLRLLGMSVRQIAESAGVPRSTVSDDVSDSGHVVPVVGSDGKAYQPETLEQRRELAAKLHGQGMSISDIADSMNVAKSTAQYLLRPRKPIEKPLTKSPSDTPKKLEGKWFVVDGQHRIETLRAVGWGDQQIQCWAYDGLNESEEAEMYLSLNDTLAQSAFDKFRIAVVAQREMECEIYRTVHQVGLTVTRDRIEGGVRAVGTLVRVYKRGGARVLKRTLTIIRDAYGTPGLEAPVIDGIGFLCDRYNGDLEDQLAIVKLANVHGGVNGLLNKGETIRRQTGQPLGQAIAAAAVEIINHGLGPRSSKRLSSWFREDAA
jgi:transposase